jgi:hypothetical protein
MGEAALDGYRAAARKTISIIRRHLPAGIDRETLEAELERNYPFWVSGGLARRVWRKEAARFMKEQGCRPRPRHQQVFISYGRSPRERRLARQIIGAL